MTPCPDKKPVRSYLTAEEHDRVAQMANRANLSISQFIRHLCLGFQLRSFEHKEFRLEFLQNRSNLGRQGGLLKIALAGSSTEPSGIAPSKLGKLLAEITICQRSLKEAVERL